MSSIPTEKEMILDLGATTVRDLNLRLQDLGEANPLARILNAKRHDFLGCGLRKSGQVVVSGPIGDFCWGGITTAHVAIEGNANHACGFGLSGGSILIQGNAGDSLGCFARSGWVATYGSCGDRCGTGLQGGELIVRGSVGNEAAYGMTNGVLWLAEVPDWNLAKR